MRLARTPPSLPLRAAACAVAMALAACSGRAPSQPTEADVHAGDLRSLGPVTDTHVFACDDGSRLLVQFGRAAPTISIRERPDAAPLVLAAASSGRPYEGGGNWVVISGDRFSMDLSGGSRRTCTRQTRG